MTPAPRAGEGVRAYLLRSLAESGISDPAGWLAEHSGAALVRRLETAEARAAGREPEWQAAMRGRRREEEAAND